MFVCFIGVASEALEKNKSQNYISFSEISFVDSLLIIIRTEFLKEE